jgi:hypothetical protein
MTHKVSGRILSENDEAFEMLGDIALFEPNQRDRRKHPPSATVCDGH